MLLVFIVVVILGHNLDNSQVRVYRTIGPTLVCRRMSKLRLISAMLFDVDMIHHSKKAKNNVEKIFA